MKIAVSLLALLALTLFAVWFSGAWPVLDTPGSTAEPAYGEGLPADDSKAPRPPEQLAAARNATAPAAMIPGSSSQTAKPSLPSALPNASRSSVPATGVPQAMEPATAPASATLVPGAPPTDDTFASGDALTSGGIEYEIPAGMRAPAAFLPADRPLTPPMERFLDDVRREFDAKIAAAEDPATVWEEAREHADARYRLLFGDEAYNRKTMQDAIEALRSKGALPTPQPPAAPTP